MARTKPTTKPVVETPAEDEKSKENPRTVKSREKLAFACGEIEKLLANGEWVSSNEIHAKLAGKITDGMFGRVKNELGISHRRVKVNGKTRYEWRLVK